MIDFISIGSITADVIIVFILLFSIYRGYKRGLSMLIVNLACLVITLIGVLILFKPITNWIYNNTNIDEFFSEHIT